MLHNPSSSLLLLFFFQPSNWFDVLLTLILCDFFYTYAPCSISKVFLLLISNGSRVTPMDLLIIPIVKWRVRFQDCCNDNEASNLPHLNLHQVRLQIKHLSRGSKHIGAKI